MPPRAELEEGKSAVDLTQSGDQIAAKSPFADPDSPMPMFELGDIVDNAAMDDETKTIIEALEAARDSVGKISIRVESSQERNELGRWQRQQEEIPKVKGLLRFLHLDYKEACEKVREDAGGVTTQEFCLYHARCVGVVFYLRSLFESQRRYARKQGFFEQERSHLDLQEVCYTNGEASIRLEGVALEDFLDSDGRSKPPLSALYSFLARAFIVRHRRSYEETLRELVAQDYPWSVYPNLTKQAIEGVTAEAYSLVSIDPEPVDRLLKENGGVALASAQWTKRLYERVQEVCHGAYQALLSPDHPDSPSMRQATRPYLEQGIHEKACALFIAGLRDDSRIRQLYRKAQALAQGNSFDPEFYGLLVTSIKDYVNKIPADENIFTVDYLPTIFSGESLSGFEDRETPAMETFGAAVASVFSKSSRKNYEVEPGGVDWQGLAQPQRVEVEFNDRPTKFKISLCYENEGRESLEVAFDFDTKKQQFDWNFIEAPSDPQMVGLYKAAFFASQSILLQIQKMAERQYEERRTQATSQSQVTLPDKKERERFRDPVYDMRKQVKKKLGNGQSTRRPHSISRIFSIA